MKTILGVTKRETSGKTFPSTFALRKPVLIEELKGLGVFTTLKNPFLLKIQTSLWSFGPATFKKIELQHAILNVAHYEFHIPQLEWHI